MNTKLLPDCVWLLTIEGEDPKKAKTYYDTFPKHLLKSGNYMATNEAIRFVKFATKEEANEFLTKNPKEGAAPTKLFL